MKILTQILFCLFIPFSIIGQSGFVDYTDSLGMESASGSNGISVCDYDNDGDYDFFIPVQSGGNKLYENQGDSIFIDVAPLLDLNSYGFSRASIWADFDNDGWDDLFVSNYGSDSKLYRNFGDGLFEDVTDTSNIVCDFNCNSLNVVDINNDGLLDLYMANINNPNYLFVNQGDFVFEEQTVQYGITDELVAMGAVFFDYDMDNDPDLYLTHDADQAFIFYENNGDGTFSDVSEETGTNVERQGMGVDIGDFDLDGDMDIYLANLYENDLLRNEGDGTYINISQSSMVNDFGMGWGTYFFDYDNDTDKDIFINNMFYFGQYPNVLYRNDGNEVFTNVVEEGESMESLMGGYGAAYADFKRDGSLDIIVANTSGNDVNEIFINENNVGNWVTFELEGTVSNRNGIGTKFRLYTDSIVQIDELVGGSGYCSQNMSGEHFGLGSQENIDSLTVIWPSGIVETYDSLTVNTTYLITEGSGIEEYVLDNSSEEEEEEEEEQDPVVIDLFDFEILNPSSDFNEFEYVSEIFQEEEEEEEEEEEGIVDGITEIEESKIKAFPNPTENVIQWKLPFSGGVTLKIFDQSGKNLYSEELTLSADGKVFFNTDHLNSKSGRFIYQFTTPEKSISGTFIVLK